MRAACSKAYASLISVGSLQSGPSSYTGTVDEEGVWSGTLDIAGGLLTGTFKAKKK